MDRPRLATPRLSLVPLAPEHLPYEVELDADPQVMRFLGNGRPRTAEQVERQHHARLAEAIDGRGFWIGFGTAADSAHEFVGWWILSRPGAGHDPQTEAELGYRLLPRWWRRGLATEGARALVAYGFEQLGLERVFAETMAVNTASRATMAAVGLSYVRTFHEVFEEPIAGTEHGEVEYAVTRAQWAAGR